MRNPREAVGPPAKPEKLPVAESEKPDTHKMCGVYRGRTGCKAGFIYTKRPLGSPTFIPFADLPAFRLFPKDPPMKYFLALILFAGCALTYKVNQFHADASFESGYFKGKKLFIAPLLLEIASVANGSAKLDSG